MSSRLRSDLRHALRGLSRAPGYALAAIGVLGAGMGTSVATATIVEQILFRPLPLPGSERLVALCETNPRLEGRCAVSPANATDLAAATRTLVALGVAR